MQNARLKPSDDRSELFLPNFCAAANVALPIEHCRIGDTGRIARNSLNIIGKTVKSEAASERQSGGCTVQCCCHLAGVRIQ